VEIKSPPPPTWLEMPECAFSVKNCRVETCLVIIFYNQCECIHFPPICPCISFVACLLQSDELAQKKSNRAPSKQEFALFAKLKYSFLKHAHVATENQIEVFLLIRTTQQPPCE